MQIEFGCLAKPIKQFLPMGMKDRGRDLQMICDAISKLHVRGYLTDSETRRARLRLIRRIESEVRGGRCA